MSRVSVWDDENVLEDNSGDGCFVIIGNIGSLTQFLARSN